MRRYVRAVARGIGRVLWWPFRALGWLLRGIGRGIVQAAEFVAELVFPW